VLVVFSKDVSQEEIAGVERRITECGGDVRLVQADDRVVMVVSGGDTGAMEFVRKLPYVERRVLMEKPYKLVSKALHGKVRTVEVAGHEIGGRFFHVCAGPCSVETREQLLYTAERVSESGATFLRGGAYKPRSSPYSFQGLGKEGLDLLAEARRISGLGIITEVLSEEDVDQVAAVADVLQIGARNALNYALLRRAAGTGKAILLKRGMCSRVEEWLLAAEYIAIQGNERIILCERGIRTFETGTRSTLDLSAVALAKRETHLPVFVDPSHAAGRTDLIGDLSRAALAVGADGLLVEVHRYPERALSDSGQQLSPEMFDDLMRSLEPFAQAAGRILERRSSSDLAGGGHSGWSG